MQLTKGAIGNLISKYRSVLKKCRLMNVFGSLAVAGIIMTGVVASAHADGVTVLTNESYDTNKISISDTTAIFVSGLTVGSEQVIEINNGRIVNDTDTSASSGDVDIKNLSAGQDRTLKLNGGTITVSGSTADIYAVDVMAFEVGNNGGTITVTRSGADTNGAHHGVFNAYNLK